MVTGGPGIYHRAPIQAGVATTACTYLMFQDTFMKFKSQHYVFQTLLFHKNKSNLAFLPGGGGGGS